MRRCFQCGVNTPDERLKALGDGVFCSHCLSKFLSASEDSLEEPSNVEPSATPRAKGPPKNALTQQHRCLVCSIALKTTHCSEFLGGALCFNCTAQINQEVQAAQIATGSAVDGSAAPLPGAAAPQREVQAPRTPGSTTVVCAGCERLMPGPGSYRVVDGLRYCAGCVPFYQRRADAKHPPPLRPSEGVCECCGRATEAHDEPCQGFLLCTACRDGDRELALAVARARHRRALLALEESLAK